MEIIGMIEKIFYHNHATNEIMYAIKPSTDEIEVNEYGNILCLGNNVCFSISSPIKATLFDKIDTKKYGTVYKIKEISLYTKNSKYAVNFLTNIKGIGQKKAEKIFQILENDLQNINEKKYKSAIIDFLNEELYNQICEHINAQRDKLKIYDYLKDTKINPAEMENLYTSGYKLEQIKKNPYEILSLFGIPFHIQDYIAHKEGLNPLSEGRIKAITKEIIRMSESSGNTYLDISKETLKTIICFIKRKTSFNVFPDIVDILYEMQEGDYILEKWGKDLALYSKNAYFDEQNLLQNISRINDNAKENFLVTKEDIDEIECENKQIFSSDQKEAFYLLERSGIKILTGGAGVGKTTTIKGIISLYRKKFPQNKIRCCSPTGRATARMREATGEFSQTIHKLLNIRPYALAEDKDMYEYDDIDADLLIVDEASMISNNLMALLLNACKSEITIIFVGDANQLPSIDIGDVFRDFIKSKKFQICNLVTNHRQKDNKVIVDNAEKVLNGKSDFVTNKNFSIKRFNKKDFATALKVFCDKDTLLLCNTKKGEFGTDICNNILQEKFINKKLPCIVIGKFTYFVGDKIIFTRNNYDETNHYYNGDLGYIESVADNSVNIRTNGKIITLEREFFKDITLAYGLTVHKSQGSESKKVVFVISKEYSFMYTRQLLYTAFTRAKDRLVILIEDEVEKVAFRNEKIVFNSKLSSKINGMMHEVLFR